MYMPKYMYLLLGTLFGKRYLKPWLLYIYLVYRYNNNIGSNTSYIHDVYNVREGSEN